jgi:hypothetical protein
MVLRFTPNRRSGVLALITPASELASSASATAAAASAAAAAISAAEAADDAADVLAATADMRTTLTGNTTLYVRANIGACTFSNGSPDVTLSTHGLQENDRVAFWTDGSLPTNFTAGTAYYVIAAGLTSGVFRVATTQGGVAVSAGSSGSGTHAAATGNDSNDGSAATRASALLTIDKARELAFYNYDLNEYYLTIQLAKSHYSAGTAFSGSIPGIAGTSLAGGLRFLGDTTTPGNVIIDAPYGFYVAEGVFIDVAGFEFRNCSTGGITAVSGGSVMISGNCTFGSATSGIHMVVNVGGHIFINANYTITGGASIHMYLALAGTIQHYDKTVTLTGTPDFSDCFIKAEGMGVADIERVTYTGSATGVRFKCKDNSQIQVQFGGWDYFPGDEPGELDGSGTYGSVQGPGPLSIPSGDFAGTNGTGAQPWFTTTQDVFTTTLDDTLYEIDAVLRLTKTAGTNAHTVGLHLGGTATFTSGLLMVDESHTGVGMTQFSWDSADFGGIQATASISDAAMEVLIKIKGYVRLNAAGTIIPQYSLSAAPGGAYTTETGSYFQIVPRGPAGITYVQGLNEAWG